MKAFLASLTVFVLLVAGTAFVFQTWLSVPATEAYSRESADPRQDGAVEQREGFAPGV
ncbi:hypothetical protein [Indioceanicola profundi]|uniref:hypothetical protein n=1 Tax=Indioceanicola profundi TaxID=2220096 RepID=UPI0013C40C81|nr:hypothetical protein [Indioceanicola profundi]